MFVVKEAAIEIGQEVGAFAEDGRGVIHVVRAFVTDVRRVRPVNGDRFSWAVEYESQLR
ncbi:MAG TPA: hypothetical protein VFB31_14725 [Pseudolabrys sp.]|nr:hypothetical protein [Pseudolabrys sp.]